MYFCFNFPFGWVQKTFNRDTNHFLAKWNKAYSDSNPSGAVNVFFTRLSGDNQDLLINWAIKNFDNKIHILEEELKYKTQVRCHYNNAHCANKHKDIGLSHIDYKWIY